MRFLYMGITNDDIGVYRGFTGAGMHTKLTLLPNEYKRNNFAAGRGLLPRP